MAPLPCAWRRAASSSSRRLANRPVELRPRLTQVLSRPKGHRMRYRYGALLEPSNQQQTRPARSRPRAGCHQRRRRQRRRRWRLHTADLGRLPRVVSAWDGTRTSSPNWGLPGQRLHPRRTPRSLSHHSPSLLRPSLPQILSKSLPLTPAQLNQLDGTGTVAQSHTATEKHRASPNPLSATLPRTIPLRARTLPPRLQAPWTAAIEPQGGSRTGWGVPDAVPAPHNTNQVRHRRAASSSERASKLEPRHRCWPIYVRTSNSSK